MSDQILRALEELEDSFLAKQLVARKGAERAQGYEGATEDEAYQLGMATGWGGAAKLLNKLRRELAEQEKHK